MLDNVARRAGFTLPEEAAQKIVDDSGGNMRKAILVLEALKMQSLVARRSLKGVLLTRFVDRT